MECKVRSYFIPLWEPLCIDHTNIQTNFCAKSFANRGPAADRFGAIKNYLDLNIPLTPSRFPCKKETFDHTVLLRYCAILSEEIEMNSLGMNYSQNIKCSGFIENQKKISYCAF